MSHTLTLYVLALGDINICVIQTMDNFQEFSFKSVLMPECAMTNIYISEISIKYNIISYIMNFLSFFRFWYITVLLF